MVTIHVWTTKPLLLTLTWSLEPLLRSIKAWSHAARPPKLRPRTSLAWVAGTTALIVEILILHVHTLGSASPHHAALVPILSMLLLIVVLHVVVALITIVAQQLVLALLYTLSFLLDFLLIVLPMALILLVLILVGMVCNQHRILVIIINL